MSDFNPTQPDAGSALILASPRFEQAEPFLITGLRIALTENTGQEIPQLWTRFMQLSSNISHRIDNNFFGLCMQTSSSEPFYFYLAGRKVSEFINTPAELSSVIVSSHLYAIFIHDAHVSRIQETIFAIFDEWLPSSGYSLAVQPEHSVHHLEKYTEAFDPQTGLGGIEIWVPVKTA